MSDATEARSTPAQVAAGRATDRLAGVAGSGLARIDALAAALQEAAARSLEAHRSLPPELHDEESGRPLEPAEQRYALATVDRVLGPLVGALRRADVGQSLVEGWAEVQSALRSEAQLLDPLHLEGPPDALRQVVRHHAADRVTEGLAPLVAGAVDTLGVWVHLLERGAKQWWRTLVGVDASGGTDEEVVERDLRERMEMAEAALETALERVVSADWSSLEAGGRDLLSASRDELAADLEGAADSKSARRRPGDDVLPWSAVASSSARWVEWHREAASRVALVVTLVQVREGLYALARDEIGRVRGQAGTIAGHAEEQVAELRGLADELHRRSQEEGIPSADELDRLMHGVLDPLRERVSQAVETFNAEGGPTGSGERIAEAAYRFVSSQPERFVVHRIEEGDEPDPSVEPITFEFGRVVNQCVDAWLIERLRTSGDRVVEAAAHARTEAAELTQIILAAFDALVEQLESSETELVARDELVRTIPEALRRAAEVTDRVRKLLVHDLDDWEVEARETIDVGWERLTTRAVVSGGVGEQFAGLKSEASIAFRQLLTDGVRRVRGLYREWREHLGSAGRLGRRLQKWLEPSGAGEVEIDRSAPARELLTRIESIDRDVPLVYRRLMTSGPISEPSLLVGREKALNRIEESISGSDVRPLVVATAPGAGFSSLARVASTEFLGGDPERFCHVVLRERIETGAGLLAAFANAGIADHGFGLRQIGAQVADRFSGDGRPTVIVEGLEHAFQRRSRGMEILKSFTTAMVESAPSVCWIVGISSPAWQVALKVSPQLNAGLEAVPLDPLNRQALEEALWKRQVRSGIPLEFSAPEDASPIFARRLRRAGKGQEREALLRGEYFDRLHRQSGGWVGTALALWLDGLTIDASARRAEIRMPIPFNESFLDGLDQEEVFGLKAFLEHGTLAAEELRDVLRVTHGDAGRILERLLDAQLVAPAWPDADQISGPWVSRYRIRRVAVPLVWRFLEKRNVLHL